MTELTSARLKVENDFGAVFSDMYGAATPTACR